MLRAVSSWLGCNWLTLPAHRSPLFARAVFVLFASTTYVPQLLEAPLALFEDRLANYTQEQQQVLFEECGSECTPGARRTPATARACACPCPC